jgi:hypothetical protein
MQADAIHMQPRLFRHKCIRLHCAPRTSRQTEPLPALATEFQ